MERRLDLEYFRNRNKDLEIPRTQDISAGQSTTSFKIKDSKTRKALYLVLFGIYFVLERFTLT